MFQEEYSLITSLTAGVRIKEMTMSDKSTLLLSDIQSGGIQNGFILGGKIIQGRAGTILCGTCMFSCCGGYALGALASFHCPKTQWPDSALVRYVSANHGHVKKKIPFH